MTTVNPEAPPLNHKECLRQAASSLDTLRQQSEEVCVNHEDIKAVLTDSNDPRDILKKLSGLSGVL